MIDKALTDPIDAAEVERLLYEVGRRQLVLDAIEGEMAAAIDAAKRQFGHRLERATQAVEGAARDLRLRCEDSRADILPRGRKSLDTLYGRVGWRSQPDQVKTVKGLTGPEAAQRLIAAGREDLTRATPLPYATAIKGAGLTTTELDRYGIRIVEGGEDWYYEVDRAQVRDNEEAGHAREPR